jgi:hypothetical protein
MLRAVETIDGRRMLVRAQRTLPVDCRKFLRQQQENCGDVPGPEVCTTRFELTYRKIAERPAAVHPYPAIWEKALCTLTIGC